MEERKPRSKVLHFFTDRRPRAGRLSPEKMPVRPRRAGEAQGCNLGQAETHTPGGLRNAEEDSSPSPAAPQLMDAVGG